MIMKNLFWFIKKIWPKPILLSEGEKLCCPQKRRDYSLADLFNSSLSFPFTCVFWGWMTPCWLVKAQGGVVCDGFAALADCRNHYSMPRWPWGIPSPAWCSRGSMQVQRPGCFCLKVDCFVRTVMSSPTEAAVEVQKGLNSPRASEILVNISLDRAA